MKILWICGLPNEVRLKGWKSVLSPIQTPPWSWILGHLPPPENVELHIVCPVFGLVDNRVDFDYQGAHWHCFRRESVKKLFLYLRHTLIVRRFIKDLRPDVVHGWGGEMGFGDLATRFSSKCVVSVQGLLRLLYNSEPKSFLREMGRVYGRYMLWREQRTYDRAARLLTESEFSHTALLELYAHSSSVVPHPLRAPFLCAGATANRQHIAQFVFVGSLVSRKGAFDVVKAFASGVGSRARLVIIGMGTEREHILRCIRDNNIGNCVELIESCTPEEIAAIMRRSHFFALPTYCDTGPTALKEALASGLFPICYDNSGPHEYITRYCGYLVPTGDVEAYSEAMVAALENLEECMLKAEAAAERIKADLDKCAIWSKLMTVYKEVVR